MFDFWNAGLRYCMRKLKKETELGILNIPQLMDDELYVSYLMRSAAMNGFRKNERFFIDNKIYAGRLGEKTIGSDIGIPSARIIDLSSPDPLAGYRRMSIFNVLAPLTERNRMQRMLSDAFYSPEYVRKIPRTTVQRGKDEVKVCPLCARSEIKEYGYYWLHRKHNVPGVEVCLRHRCRLVDVSYPYLDSDVAAMEPSRRRVLALKVRVAEIAAWFLDNAPDLDLDDIRTIIRNAVLRIEESEGSLDNAIELIIKDSGGCLTRPQIESLACTAGGNNSKRHPAPETVLTLLALLSGTDELAAASVPDQREAMFRQYAKDRGYRLIGQYSKNLILLRHKCGTTFPSTPYALSHGWICPECGAKLTKERIFKHIFDTVSCDEYVLLDEYVRNDANINLRHVCGRTFSVRARSFLCEDAQCPCKRIFSASMSDKMVRFVTGGRYETIGPYNPFDRTIEIRHVCGSTGRYNLARFLAGERCPVCNDFRDEPVGFEKTVQRDRKLEFYRTRAVKEERSRSLLGELEERYGHNDFIFREDLEDNPTTRGRIAALVEDGALVKYGPGAYGFPDSPHTFEEVVESRYLGNFGYMFGESFAYQLGLVSKPDVFVIVSNKAGNAIGRKVTYEGGIVVLKRTREPLDGSKVPYFCVFDFLPFMDSYDGAAEKVRNYIIGRFGSLPDRTEFDRLVKRYGYRSQGRLNHAINLIYGGGRCVA